MKTLKQTFLLLFFLILFTSGSKDKDFIPYFRAANQAELSIGKGDYKEALVAYKTLFKEYPHSLEREVYNAFLCAMEENLTDDALSLAKQLVLHGYELKDFGSPAFEKFKNNAELWRKLSAEYPKLRKKFEKSYNPTLMKKYEALNKTDQYYASGSVDGLSVDSAYYSLFLSIRELINKNGFPPLINKPSLDIPIYAMLRHYGALENKVKHPLNIDTIYTKMKDINVHKLAYEALHQGLLTPEMYCGITTYMGENPYGKIYIEIDYEAETVKTLLYVLPEQREAMNRKRDEIGLPVIGEVAQDAINSTWYREFPFKKIKEAWLACDTCTKRDYLLLGKKIELEVEKKYPKNYFRYYTKNIGNEIYELNSQKYKKNLPKRK
ncbi:MAG: hypothetical protein LBR64_08280 [Dysgonamonadaceae bacterium]|jgi:hypothetical protein|nr:hypothetical protein [Dysgonamonadaceae bacterium]